MDYQPKHLHKMTPRWLFPYLAEGDALFGTKRWQYWSNTLLDLRIPDDPIPQVLFHKDANDQGVRETIKHIAGAVTVGERLGGWRHSEVFERLVIWILHGLGDPEFLKYETPDKIPDMRVPIQVFDEWYEYFQLGLLQKNPFDYMAFFAQGGANKDFNAYKGLGFFATPAAVCQMMAEMTFGGQPLPEHKRASMCDPCCGTGGLLLAASNYSLNLYGVDVSLSMVRYCRLNSWLYMPWMVFWPDFGFIGLPVKHIKRILFDAPAPAVLTPDIEKVAPIPMPQNILTGEFKQTEKGQYVLPLFESLVLTE